MINKYKLSITLQVVNICLFLGMLIALFSFIVFNKSLNLDGSHNLLRIIANHSFYELETIRQIFYIIQQLPVLLFIHFSSSSSRVLLIHFFSFGLVYIHLISFLACWFILPKNKKHMVFFPLFAFLTGPLVALGISISTSISLSSYIWFVAFLIYYSDFSLKIHRILFVIAPLLLILSHELMSYMAWLLIYLCIVKLRTENNVLNRFLIKYVISFSLVCSLIAVFCILFPDKSEISNRAEFFNILFYLKFFLTIDKNEFDHINSAILSVFFLQIYCYRDIIRQTYYKLYSRICFFFILLFGIIALITPFYSLFNIFKLTNEEEARVWLACISLPSSLLIWYLFENKQLKLKREFLFKCLLVLVLILGWRIGSDYQFYRFQKQISNNISYCKGLVSWNQIVPTMNLIHIGEFNTFHLMPFSIFVQNKPEISVLLISNTEEYSKILLCHNKNCKISKNLAKCYFTTSTTNKMCKYFNVYHLDKSRFFNFQPLISSINQNKSYCAVNRPNK